jgi:hypothetical protein
MFKCRILFTPLSPFNLWILVTIFKGFERLKCPPPVALLPESLTWLKLNSPPSPILSVVP